MKSTYIAAIVVAALFVAWLFSGQLGNGEERQPAPSLAQSRDAMLAEAQDAPVRVRARVVAAESQTEDLVVRGRTEADRSVVVRAETSGRVVELPVERGDRVEAGALLCRIAVDTREARLEEMRQAVAQARIEFEGARKLRDRGLQSETAIASAEARLAANRANLAQAELDLERTYIRAPFAGIVEERPVELGALLQAGGACATVVDPDPMMLVGQVSEQDVARLVPGEAGFGELVTGEAVAGTLAFVAATASPSTRTFRVEVAVPNADGALRDGITTEIRIPVERFFAHRIPSSILALDDAGDLGVRILDENDRVEFVNVRIVKDEADGIWVRGLPDPARVITVGQELVTPGQQVEPVFEAGNNTVTRSEEEEAPAAYEGSSIAAPASSGTMREDTTLAAAAAAI